MPAGKSPRKTEWSPRMRSRKVVLIGRCIMAREQELPNFVPCMQCHLIFCFYFQPVQFNSSTLYSPPTRGSFIGWAYEKCTYYYYHPFLAFIFFLSFFLFLFFVCFGDGGVDMLCHEVSVCMIRFQESIFKTLNYYDFLLGDFKTNWFLSILDESPLTMFLK